MFAISDTELCSRLSSSGHSLVPLDHTDREPCTDVWPPSDIIISVALQTDSTLGHEFRQRFFICATDNNDVALVEHLPRYHLSGHYIDLFKHFNNPSRFVQGPFRWLLAHLVHFHQLLLWPKTKYRIQRDGWFFQTWEKDVVEHLLKLIDAELSTLPSKLDALGAIVLECSIVDHCFTLLEVANYVGVSHNDFWISDMDAKEVYLLHHHDKIVASLPDCSTRHSLLEACRSPSSGLIDVSGYQEDENGGEEEQ